MYRKLLCCLLVVVMVFVSGGARLVLPVEADALSAEKNVSTEASATKRDFTDSEVLVAMTHEESLKFTKYTAADFAEIGCASVQDLSSAKAEKVQKVLRGEKLAEDSIGAAFMNKNINVDTFHRILSLKLAEPGKENVLRAVDLLNQREDVYIAEPNYIIQMDRAIVPEEPPAPDNNPLYGWAAEKINQEDAWEIEDGSAIVWVGVVDSGIDVSHPELSGKVSSNYSRNFASDNLSPLTDLEGHGTHVAGIIAAKHNADSLNFSGVCQDVTLISLRVFNSQGRSSWDVVAEALQYAEDNYIPILNISMQTWFSNYTYSLPDCILHNYDGLVIGAAGNSGSDLDEKLAEHPYQLPGEWNADTNIIVGASTQTDGKLSGSNYGLSTVDLFAPGDTILSCYPLSLCSATNCTAEGHVAYGYHKMSGTSMAAPFVTGVAALILAHRPSIALADIKAVIIDSVYEVNSLSRYCITGGVLDAHEALSKKAIHIVGDYAWRNSTTHWVYSDCGNVAWTERHEIHPGLGICLYCRGTGQ